MDDLEQVATLLAKPEPSGDVIGRGRDQLTEAIRAPAGQPPARRHPGRPHPAGRPARWNSGGLLAGGAALAAAAVTVVIASGLVTPGGKVPLGGPGPGTRSSRPAVTPTTPSAAQSPAQRILLAAAATALRQRPGTYWHFKIRINPTGDFKPPPGEHVVNTYESWIALNGKWWNAQPRCAAPPGTAVFEGPGFAGYSIGNLVVTYQVTRHLPTNPTALTAWIARHDKPGGGQSFVPETLISLLWQVPAPPAVRAAAFQALAAWPGVTSLGPVKGGVGLLISYPHMPAGDWDRLVIDPATALVRSDRDFKGTTIIHAGWTNHLPRVIPLPPKDVCGS